MYEGGEESDGTGCGYRGWTKETRFWVRFVLLVDLEPRVLQVLYYPLGEPLRASSGACSLTRRRIKIEKG